MKQLREFLYTGTSGNTQFHKDKVIAWRSHLANIHVMGTMRSARGYNYDQNIHDLYICGIYSLIG